LESPSPQTRNAAYNLLAALAVQFQFPVTLLESKDISVPHNTGDLVVTLSKQVARAKVSLTMSFLNGCLKGYKAPKTVFGVQNKYLLLKFMKPWIHNLPLVYDEIKENPEELQTLLHFFSGLTEITFQDKDIYPALLNEIWTEIVASKEAVLVKMAIDAVIKETERQGLEGMSNSAVADDFVVTLSSGSSSSIIVDLIFAILESTLEDEVKSSDVESETAWTKISLFMRFLLMLSFQNRLNVLQNIPHLFYVVVSVSGRGSLYLRSTMHGLLINALHSLATSLKFSDADKQDIQGFIHQLSSPEFKKLFMGLKPGSTIEKPVFYSSDPFAQDPKDKTKPEPTDMWQMENLVGFLMKVIQFCGRFDPLFVKTWTEDWTRLVKSKAIKLMQNNELIPRLQTTYGILVPVNHVKESLPFVLNQLCQGVQSYRSDKPEAPVSAILCLSQMSSKLDADDETHSQLLLLSLVICTSCDQPLVLAALHMFDTALDRISISKLFKESSSLENYFKKALGNENFERHVARLESLSQISFNTHFSFAIATFLMKGITFPVTKVATTKLLLKLIAVSKMLNQSNKDLLGYFTALIPYDYDEVLKILGKGETMFTEEIFESKVAPLLFIKYLLVTFQVLQDSEKESKKLSIFYVLIEAFRKLPGVFQPVYYEAMLRAVQFYSTCTSAKMADVILELIDVMMLAPDFALKKDDPNTFLKEICFTGITRAGNFKVSVDTVRECNSLLMDLYQTMAGSGKPDHLPFSVEEHSLGDESDPHYDLVQQQQQQQQHSNDEDGKGDDTITV